MKHKQLISFNETLTVMNEFRFFMGILIVQIYSEERGSGEFKSFVDIKVFGRTIMDWVYRDNYLRDFYVKDKTIKNYEKEQK